MGDIVIPEKYQELVLKVLEGLKDGSIVFYDFLLSLVGWMGMLVLGVLLGYGFYNALVMGASHAMAIYLPPQLNKALGRKK